MDADPLFLTQKPNNQFLATLVDYYFYVDVDRTQQGLDQELIIPCPRITFGYFFNYPFTATNHTLNQSATVNMAISRISTQQITVQPQTDRVKIIGAHVQPHCLAYLTKQPVSSMPWLINTTELFQTTATDFQQRIERCRQPEQMFNEVERVFLDNMMIRDLSLITKAIELIEKSAGTIPITQLAHQLDVSERTIRSQFQDHVGCSPKEYIRLVRLQQVAYQLRHSPDSLTDIAYKNDYFDQAHFIHEVKDITGMSPGQLRKQIPTLRFLQF
ncbi:helix-turn-helix transcriptional regulator [Spirosoma validum]|uniref:Helix-turn-helix transcriptional regulator n=1 Tax=Spirosoma validum TaxID=2771355 RepID=A0A927B942_9BACT|nr:helix-turn-helix transcriptional regulator [Spirosoma validum]MBD2757457.1 helix-turn-helix transcriptional regulator [Spirosoma validum]